MSEPTNAQMAEQEDMRLDAQIDEWYAQFLVPVNRPVPHHCEDAHDWRPINEPGADYLCAKCGERNERDPEVIQTFDLTRQQRDVMGQDEDGTPNGEDYIEARWVSQWERVAALPFDDPVKHMREMLEEEGR